jgi:Xaa-Pro aminopeptidase
MESKFSSRFFAANRKKLQDLFIGNAPIVMTANGLLQRGGDTTYPFSQDASFWYLTGIDDPDILLIIDKSHEYLIVPSRSISREAFDGAIDYDDLANKSGIKEIYNDQQGWEKLVSRIKQINQVAIFAPPISYIDSFGFYTNPARANLSAKLQNIKSGLELFDLAPHLVTMRTIKQPPELNAIQEAIDITNDILNLVLDPSQLDSYSYEYQIEADISRGYRASGASGHAFDPIVASGAKACTLHNTLNNGSLAAKDLVLVDTGAEFDHYAADITRTVIAGEPSSRQKAVHAAVLNVQEYAFSLVKPGIFMREYEKQIELYMGKKLLELGLIKTADTASIRRYYPHATSHYLGLNVHDVADYSLPIESGTVMTVEPGIYIEEEGIGIRIEDDVLVTESGIKVLSSQLPRGLNLVK